jgi:hypothetical protein
MKTGLLIKGQGEIGKKQQSGSFFSLRTLQVVNRYAISFLFKTLPGDQV